MSNEHDELGLALVRAKREFRCDLLPQVAERLIGRVAYRYSVGESFRDAVNAVTSPGDFPDRRKQLAYRKVIKAVMGRRGGLARHKRAA